MSIVISLALRCLCFPLYACMYIMILLSTCSTFGCYGLVDRCLFLLYHMIILFHALECPGLDICGSGTPRCGEVILKVFPIMIFIFYIGKLRDWSAFLHTKHVLLFTRCGRPSCEKVHMM